MDNLQFWMNKIIEEAKEQERKQILNRIRNHCNYSNSEVVTYPVLVKLISPSKQETNK